MTEPRRARRPNITPSPMPGAVVFDHRSHRVDVWKDDVVAWVPLIAFDTSEEASLFVHDNCVSCRAARVVERELCVTVLNTIEWHHGKIVTPK